MGVWMGRMEMDGVEMSANYTSHSNTSVYSPNSSLLAPYYIIIVPILLVFCFGAFLGNLALLACVPWIRRTAMTVNLRLSLSLAAADAWAALLIFCGIIVNSYIPVVLDVRLGPWTACYFLVLEFLRLAGLITSVLHLLTLSLNHWLSVFSPLKYKRWVNTGAFKLTTLALWAVPLLAMFVYGLSSPHQGFRTTRCHYSFYYRFRFRFVLFLQFTSPLLVMLLVYGDILRRVGWSAREQGSLKGQWRVHSGRAPFVRNSSSVSVASAGQGRRKGLVTTLLIVGSFACGWLPAIFVFVLVCTDCPIPMYPLHVPVFAVQVAVNSLMLAKLLINPFIYGFRMLDIRFALWAMKVTRFGTRPMPLNHAPTRFHRLCLGSRHHPRE